MLERHSMKLEIPPVNTTHENKILFPQDNISKGDMIHYYTNIAPMMIPFMANRPLTMQRFVNGITAESFFQKDASNYFPEWIMLKRVAKKSGGHTDYIICNNIETLVYLANQNCITFHLWLSKVNKLRNPDRMIFDIDPSTDNFALVVATALKLKDILESLGLASFVLTTGSRGAHVIVPLDTSHTYKAVKAFSRLIASILVANDPDNLTLELLKEKRGEKVFIDTLRNEYGATAVAPYSIRPYKGAPVATPVTWNELKKLKSSQAYTIKTVFDYLKKVKNPWPGFFELKQNITVPQKLLEKILKIKGAL